MNEIKETILNKEVFKEEPQENTQKDINVKNEKGFKELLKETGRTEQDVITAIEQLIEKNKYEETIEILNGKIKIKLVAPTPGIADALLTLAEEWTDGSMSKFEHKYSVATVASVIDSFKDINLNKECDVDELKTCRKRRKNRFAPLDL